MHALDTLDDQFARMAAALLALLSAHNLDSNRRCSQCPVRESGCDVIETVHHYLSGR